MNYKFEEVWQETYQNLFTTFSNSLKNSSVLITNRLQPFRSKEILNNYNIHIHRFSTVLVIYQLLCITKNYTVLCPRIEVLYNIYKYIDVSDSNNRLFIIFLCGNSSAETNYKMQ